MSVRVDGRVVDTNVRVDGQVAIPHGRVGMANHGKAAPSTIVGNMRQ
jgi:hypothetical protein